jgi:hypothetical protein
LIQVLMSFLVMDVKKGGEIALDEKVEIKNYGK